MSKLIAQSRHLRLLSVDLVACAASSALAWSLLWYLHGALQAAWQPLACGLLGGGLIRRWLHATYAAFARFLASLFGSGIVLVGTVLAVLGTLGLHLHALQAQINPHSPFNAFNSLAELVHEDAHAAEGLVEDLAHLMRYSLQRIGAPSWLGGVQLEP